MLDNHVKHKLFSAETFTLSSSSTLQSTHNNLLPPLPSGLRTQYPGFGGEPVC
ncbi:hypothetical protein Mapa_003839 [Marchantia paleacea]|nr:hypothetical protein Mapa_003839 [Marchantia paleacea]